MLFLGIAAGLAARWAFPEADPPLHRQTGAYWCDEVWGFSARNGVLWGTWEHDAWKPWVACPIHTLAIHGSFLIFGLNGLGQRFPAMLGGSLILAFAFLQARALGLSRISGLVAAFMLATSWSMTGFGRTSVLEPLMMTFFAASLLAVFAGERAASRGAWWYGGAGVLAGLSLLTKLSVAPVVFFLGTYLLLGATGRTLSQPWRWRMVRATAFAAGLMPVVALGSWLWIVPEWEAFHALVLQTSLADRVRDSSFIWPYNAVAWLESQAFLTTPLTWAVLLVLLPVLKHLPSRAGMAAFAVYLAGSVLVPSIVVFTALDVPARRYVWANILLALLAGIVWDLFNERPAAPPPEPGRLGRAGWCILCLMAGGLLAGGIVSPNGGLPAFVAPETAAHLLFDLPAKITYKLLWVGGGLALGAGLYRARTKLCANGRRLLTGALAVQCIVYLGACGLWVGRLSYSVRDASRATGAIVGEGNYVLGNAAANVGFFNRTRPIYWSPRGFLFANHDERRIRSEFDPEYLMLDSITFEEMRAGRLEPSAYVSSFLSNEIARFPVYELHESMSLSGSLVVFRQDSSSNQVGAAVE